jgi:hypothetical protein
MAARMRLGAARACAGLALFVLGGATAWAQEHPHSTMASQPAPSAPGSMSRRPLDLPETRDASGTAWQPDATPMHAVHAMIGRWMFMFHGNVFAGYDVQGSDRGGSGLVSQNWVMAMMRRSAADAEIGARVMLSAEPLTVGRSGYPLLLQTGETYRGAPLHDRQHPHDLFMETAIVATIALGDDVGMQVYAAPAGEPALGPVGFPHRASASSDPMAPLGHHWQDSTHISFGVLTAGVFTRHVKLEGSWFNGREPDEARNDFDLRVPDSLAARLSVNPAKSLSLQASYGFLRSPETSEPETSVHRVTGSATLDVRLGTAGNWATTAVWGTNISSDEPVTSSWLLETELNLDGHNIVFGRAEYVEKTGHDLVLSAASAERAFDVGNVALGYLFELDPMGPLLAGIGARGAVSFVGAGLERFYGIRLPLGAMVFARVRAAEM